MRSKRTKNLSAVAGIIDTGGGLRIVVTEHWRMHYHVRKGERLFVVPDLLVQEPVPWDMIPAVIHKTEKHVLAQLAPKNPCGECRQCCTTLYIANEGDGFSKPSHQACHNCSADLGCKVHWNRPKVCRAFECKWLKSQSLNDVMPPELRPDRCGVIFTDDSDGDPETFECHIDHMTEVAQAFIDAEQAIGRKAKLVMFYHGEAKP